MIPKRALAALNIFLCVIAAPGFGGLAADPARPSPGQARGPALVLPPEREAMPVDADACARLDPALAQVLDRPSAGALVAIGASARRKLRCAVPALTCTRLEDGLRNLLAAGAAENQVLSVLSLYDELSCPGAALVGMVESARGQP